MTIDVNKFPSPCADCLSECNNSSCKLDNITEECTDHCVVVPCSDPTHDQPVCVGDCLTAPCEMLPCDGGSDCTGTYEELLECCTDYHSYYQDPTTQSDQSNLAWMDSPATYANAPSSRTPSMQRQSSASRPSYTPLMIPSTAPGLQQQQPRFGGAQFQQHVPTQNHISRGGFVDNHSQSMQFNQQHSPQYVQFPRDYNKSPLTPQYAQSPRPTTATPTRKNVQCLWAQCSETFSSMEELVGHVNLAHLRPSAHGIPNLGSPRAGPPSASPWVSCMWDDCNLFPIPAVVSGPSSASHRDAALNVLSNHLLQDHLGLSTARYVAPTTPAQQNLNYFSSPPPQRPPLQLQTHSVQSYADMHSPNGYASSPQQDRRDIPTPPSSSSGSPAPQHDCSSSHVCQWRGCGRTFPSCDDLTSHISSQHVGSGQSQYHCYWAGCNRNGEQGFSSKQKILRHLQSHTGHRPFQCTICNQNFSEAATLQQHMRRHTQEKPYVCDFPGCNKAFAITGALTIHKRTHNGEKPFNCPHCGRAFAESSNLSKHLRTHTGARPYVCPEPGCEKAFARPDQLARHANVHEKKRRAEGSSSMLVDTC